MEFLDQIDKEMLIVGAGVIWIILDMLLLLPYMGKMRILQRYIYEKYPHIHRLFREGGKSIASYVRSKRYTELRDIRLIEHAKAYEVARTRFLVGIGITSIVFMMFLTYVYFTRF